MDQHNMLYERFRKVILGAGYSTEAAIDILSEYYPQYIKDIPKFIEMLVRYETNQCDPQ